MKFAIYTACIGGYDNIVQPEVIDDRFDYYLFTDDVEGKQIGVWQVRQVDYANPDKTRIARYVKTHPHELLPEYDATLWMDANIQIISQKIYERFEELYRKNYDLASICHPFRDCIYDEAFEVSYSKQYGRLEHDNIAVNWCSHIFREQYPSHNGLFETGILFRMNSEDVAIANNLWWECIDLYSKRDQLSCNYVVWIYRLKTDYFLPKGEYAEKSSNVRYICHDRVARRKHIVSGFHVQWYYKTINISKFTQSIGKRIWERAYSSEKPVIVLRFYEFTLGIVCIPFLLCKILTHRIVKELNK